MNRDSEEAVLLTGVYGSGKSSVAAEMASVLEDQGVPHALLDLDFLAWFDAGADGPTEHRIMLTNLAAVVGNYSPPASGSSSWPTPCAALRN